MRNNLLLIICLCSQHLRKNSEVPEQQRAQKTANGRVHHANARLTLSAGGQASPRTCWAFRGRTILMFEPSTDHRADTISCLGSGFPYHLCGKDPGPNSSGAK